VSKKSQLALLSVPIRKVQANSIAPKSNAKQNLKRKLVRHLHKIVHMLCDVGRKTVPRMGRQIKCNKN